MMGLKRALACILVLGLCWGCGSGGGGGSAASQNPGGAALTGQIIDSAIEGLDYHTLTRSGLTGSGGTFSYFAGEEVRFSIGSVPLGATAGKPVVSVLDLAAGAMRVSDRWVANMARLLQSLDSDCDLRNGIQISTAARSVVTGRHIDFDQEPWDFSRDAALVQLFSDLNAAGVFAGGCPAGLRPADLAVSHLQKSINDTWKLVSAQDDQGSDGSVDRVKRIVRDADGRVTDYEDGILGDYTAYNDYDADGNVVRRRIDWNRDGVVDDIYEYRYDSKGFSIEEKIDFGADGFDEFKTITRDALGREIERFAWTASQSWRYRWFYDSDGNIIREEVDEDDDGTVDYAEAYTYDRGNRIERLSTNHTNGHQYRITSEYSGALLVREFGDNEADGLPDYRTDYDYDAAGNLLSRFTFQADYGTGSLVWNLIESDVYAYDAKGRFIEQTVTFIYSQTDVYHQVVTRDENGNIIRDVMTWPSGRVDTRTYVWDEQSVPEAFDIYVPGGGELSFS